MATITFLGAAGTVTGSKYLVKGKQGSVLVDAGLFQGGHELRDRNWEAPPKELEEVDAVLLTHAHIDHTGMLPRWGAQGLNCPIYGTHPTVALAGILLPDSGRLQEEEASYRVHRVGSRHRHPQPLYTEEDARRVLTLFQAVPLESDVPVAPGITAQWSLVGHILGACSIRLTVDGKTILLSGDIGRYSDDLLMAPKPPCFAEVMLMESTYGGRSHGDVNLQEAVGDIINETVARRGLVLIPSFAVGRTQQLLYHLKQLKMRSAIPDIPIVVDSPMARDATEIYARYLSFLAPSVRSLLTHDGGPFRPSHLGFTASREDSKRLNDIDEPMVLIAASGMLSGGRVLHHLSMRVSNPRNTVLFVGFQPPGGRGDEILRGAPSIRVFHEEVPVRAAIREVSGLSAHADHGELLRWAGEGEGRPDRVFLVHGEPSSAAALKEDLIAQKSWSVSVAAHRQEVVV